MEIQNKEPNELEKIIEQLLKLKDDTEQINQEQYLLNNYIYKLEDNNLSYKTIIEKLLENEDCNIDHNENTGKYYKKIKNFPNEKKVSLLKLQIENYNKNIVKQNEVLIEEKNEKRIINFMNINKLINNKNKELEELILESNKLQNLYNDIYNKVDFLNYYIKKYKDNNFNLKIKIEMKKKNKIIKNLIFHYKD